MMPQWISLHGDASWLETLSSSRGLALVLWVGLALLTLSLLVLMRTRWGQARPLSKCVVLSVFAHLLFLGYAYGTRLLLDVPPLPEEPFIRLAIVAPSDDSSSEDPEQRDDAWQEPFATMAMTPAVAAPERPPSEIVLPDTTRPPEAPVFGDPPQEDALGVLEVERTDDEPATALTAPPLEAAPSELEIDTVPARRVSAQPVAVPIGAPLPRPQTGLARDTSLAADPPTDGTSELVEDLAQLQRLADVAALADRAEATLAAQDDTRRADHRDRESGEAPPAASGGDETDGQPRPAAAPPLGQLDRAGLLAAIPVALRLGDSAPLPDVYRLRAVRQRLPLIEPLGGNQQTEAAVAAALSWLAAHQREDGRWDASLHGGGREDRVRGHNRQQAGMDADTGITGLAVLALLGAGHTHFEGMYRRNVQHGLEFLVSSQQRDGCLAGQARVFARMYCHGIACLAVCEAYAMTGDHRLEPYVQRAVQYTVAAQHTSGGGWRYQPGDPGDMSQFGWQLMALQSAELAGQDVPAQAKAGMRRFLDSLSYGPHLGLASYRQGEAPSRTMTAEALLCRWFLERAEPSAVREAVDYVLEELPQPGQANFYYWYYATLALYQQQGEAWQQWNAALQEQLLLRQRQDGDLAGSWDSDTLWGGYGGRVYTTALGTMCLEVYYRYLPILRHREPALAAPR